MDTNEKRESVIVNLTARESLGVIDTLLLMFTDTFSSLML